MGRLVPSAVVDVLRPQGDLMIRGSATERGLRRNAALHRRHHPGSTMMLMSTGGVSVWTRNDWRLSIERRTDGRCPGCCYSCRDVLSHIEGLLDRVHGLLAQTLELDEGGGSAAYLLLRARRYEEAAQMLDYYQYDTMQEAEAAVGDGADTFLEVVRDAEKAVADGAEQFLRDEVGGS